MRIRLFLAVAVLAASVALGTSAQEKEKDSAGVVFSGKASAKDVGLPFYPGSIPHKEKDNDSEGMNFNLWGGGSGVKLAVAKMDTSDSPDKVAAFYKKALAKYGKVLDCTNPPPASDSGKDSNALTCGDDKPDAGGLLFKAGTKDKQHIVGIKPYGNGTTYDLVALGNWSSDKH